MLEFFVVIFTLHLLTIFSKHAHCASFHHYLLCCSECFVLPLISSCNKNQPVMNSSSYLLPHHLTCNYGTSQHSLSLPPCSCCLYPRNERVLPDPLNLCLLKQSARFATNLAVPFWPMIKRWKKDAGLFGIRKHQLLRRNI